MSKGHKNYKRNKVIRESRVDWEFSEKISAKYLKNKKLLEVIKDTGEGSVISEVNREVME